MLSVSKHGQMEDFLKRRGLPASLWEQGDLLILSLPAADQERLLSDDSLRTGLVRQARSLGFSRIALELI